jgi:hypothetical protein
VEDIENLSGSVAEGYIPASYKIVELQESSDLLSVSQNFEKTVEQKRHIEKQNFLLEKSVKRLAAFMPASFDALVFVENDIIIDANEVFYDLTRFRKQDVIGHSFCSIFECEFQKLMVGLADSKAEALFVLILENYRKSIPDGILVKPFVYKSKNIIVAEFIGQEDLKTVFLGEQNPVMFEYREEINSMKDILIRLTRENELMQNQIEFKTLQIARTNDLLERIAVYLREVKFKLPSGKNNYIEQIDNIGNEIKQHHSIGLWNEFKLRFADVHPGFYDRLIAEYPALTETDLRLCAFIKLKMSTKEIAYFIHQPVNSVKVARNRLRKKLRIIDASQSLLTLLAEF